MSLFSSSDPYLIDILPLGTSPGSHHYLQDRVITPEQIGLDLIAVPSGAELDCDLLLQILESGVLVSGSISALAQGECARCLNPVALPMQVQITELFHKKPEITRSQEYGAATHKTGSPKKGVVARNKAVLANHDMIEPDESEDELFFIEDGRIDLEQSIIDAIALSLPLTPLCEEDCAGLCVDCGINLNTIVDPQVHTHDKIDPRFAQLQGLLSNIDSGDKKVIADLEKHPKSGT